MATKSELFWEEISNLKIDNKIFIHDKLHQFIEVKCLLKEMFCLEDVNCFRLAQNPTL